MVFIDYHILCGNFRQEKILAYFTICCHRQKLIFIMRNFCPVFNNDYMNIRDMATFTTLTKIYSTKVAGLGEIFVKRKTFHVYIVLEKEPQQLQLLPCHPVSYWVLPHIKTRLAKESTKGIDQVQGPLQKVILTYAAFIGSRSSKAVDRQQKIIQKLQRSICCSHTTMYTIHVSMYVHVHLYYTLLLPNSPP